MRTRGLLIIKPKNRHWMKTPEERQQLDTFAALAALALERVHFIQVAQDALVHMESERIRNALLAGLSHDLKTPMASMLNLSKSLVKSDSALTPLQKKLAQSLKEEILHMERLINNLLEMARIKSGELKLNLQWRHFEEIIVNAMRVINAKITTHPIDTLLEEDLPLIYLDAVLMEKVLSTLLERACKYTPKGTSIILEAAISQDNLCINIYDKALTLSAGQAKAIAHFKHDFRIDLEVAIAGAIIEAHGGKIHLGHSPMGGTSIICSIPLKPSTDLIVSDA